MTHKKPATAQHPRGFTLVELLVVIGIIAVLMGILMPSLSRARQQARQVQCQASLKQFGAAQMLYVAECKGWCVPIKSADDAKLKGQYGTVGYIRWDFNEVFRKCLMMESPKNIGTTTAWAEEWPMGLLCQEAVGAVENNNRYVMYSYGMNREGIFRDTNGDGKASFADAIAYKWTEVKRSSEKIMMMDAQYWVAAYFETAGATSGNALADYRRHWDVKGENQQSPNGQTMYRHRQGANVLFADGHCEWRAKQDLFKLDGATNAQDDTTNLRSWNLLLQ
jgi:prepilin-type N-terminal cleavage/methylation domain-containing protein/prepilin-type processing-associated H-X9-DG protein